jgi:hypothetical protein
MLLGIFYGMEENPIHSMKREVAAHAFFELSAVFVEQGLVAVRAGLEIVGAR